MQIAGAPSSTAYSPAIITLPGALVLTSIIVFIVTLVDMTVFSMRIHIEAIDYRTYWSFMGSPAGAVFFNLLAFGVFHISAVVFERRRSYVE